MSRHRQLSHGFALPTVLIASVIMLIVLLGSIQAATAARASLENQRYNQLARAAAESGTTRAKQCIEENDNTAPWISAGKVLTPKTDCSGNDISTASLYVFDSTNARTSFTVDTVTTTPNSLNVKAEGKVELKRTSTGSVWRSYESNLNSLISLGVIEATNTASGIFQVCGIFDGQTWCWGKNNQGQLGIGTIEDDDVNHLVPLRVARLSGGLLGKRDKLVASGNLSMCIVTEDNLIYCTGDNGSGQLGISPGTGYQTTNYETVPKLVNMTSSGMAGKEITDIVMGSNSTCAVASQDVYCWGGNAKGQLGINSTTGKSSPVRINTIGAWTGKPVTEIAMTPYALHACAVASGQAYCWGYNDRGQLGDGTYDTDRRQPVPVTATGALSGKTVVHIATAAGYRLDGNTTSDSGGTADSTRRGHACVVTSDGGLYCWGSNQYGQMGQGSGSLTRQTTPIKVNGLLSGKTVVQVATAYANVCALTSDNNMYCWGQNTYGSVGDGTTGTHRLSPVAIAKEDPGLLNKTITSISGGVNRNCAIADAVSYCWGVNSTAGQLGDGTLTNRNKPTEAKLLRKYMPTVMY